MRLTRLRLSWIPRGGTLGAPREAEAGNLVVGKFNPPELKTRRRGRMIRAFLCGGRGSRNVRPKATVPSAGPPKMVPASKPRGNIPPATLTKSAPVNAFDQLCRYLRSSWPDERWRDVTVLVAVSGGADSVALLHALVEIKHRVKGNGRLVVAHYNHAVRGEKADADQAFVRETAEQLGLKCEIGCWQSPADEAGRAPNAPSDEATMRSSRYAFLAGTAHRVGARYVATGHTLDDNVETMLHHLFRGTGPAGLAGMPAHRELASDVLLIRPFLSVDRKLVRESLRAIELPWREDDSNVDPRWKRNWIRHTLLPLIEQQYPAASQRIGSALASQRKLVEMLDGQADQWIELHCQIDAGDRRGCPSQRVQIACGETATLHDQSPVVIHALRRLWQHLGWPRRTMREEHWQRLWRSLSDRSEPGFTLPGKIRVAREPEQLTIQRQQ